MEVRAVPSERMPVYQMVYETHSANTPEYISHPHVAALTALQCTSRRLGHASGRYISVPMIIEIPVTPTGEWRSISGRAPIVYTAQQHTATNIKKSPRAPCEPSANPCPTTR